MRVGIDISQIVYEGAGVAVYTRNLVESLLGIDKKNEYVLFGSSLRRTEALRSFATLSGSHPDRGAAVHAKIWPLPPTVLEVLWNRLHVLPIENLTGNLDIFHASDWTQPPTQRAKKVTTIHDLLIYKYPEYSHPNTGFRTDVWAPSPNIVAAQRRRLEWVKREGDLIIAVSESTKKDVVEILGIPEERIRVVSEAAGRTFTKFKVQSSKFKVARMAAAREKYGLKRPYVLAVGTREPRKNLRRLIEAYQSLNLKDIDLVIVGKYGWGDETQNSKLKTQNNIKLVGYVGQEELPAVYAGAEVFVYPSLYEGFGLPVLEAFVCGCPVVTSKVSSLPEVGGEAAIYVENPREVGEIAGAVLKALKLPKKEREGLIQKGFAQAAKFSWEKVARETLRVYQEVFPWG